LISELVNTLGSLDGVKKKRGDDQGIG
jgi:hypothetical protein